MKIVFIAGPYRAPTEWGVHSNIQRAEQAAVAIWKLGISVICPHKNTAYFGGAAPDRVWLDGAQEQLRRSDAIFLVSGFERSEGAQNEIALAKELGLPIFKKIEEVEHWLKHESPA